MNPDTVVTCERCGSTDWNHPMTWPPNHARMIEKYGMRVKMCNECGLVKYPKEKINLNPVLILTKNNLEMNKRCVASALAQDIPTKVFVYDNLSTDGTADWVKNNPDVMDISTGIDLGVSEGWNYALHNLFFERCGAMHVLVINSDTMLPSWFYSTLLSYDGPMITGVSVGTMEEIAAPPPRKELVSHPDFSAYLIRKECWEKVGEFDGNMVLYVQDLDYHIRAHRLGLRLMNAGVPFLHIRSSTLNNASPQEKQEIRDRADQDRAIFQKKWKVAALGGDSYAAMFSEETFGIDWKNMMREHNTL